MIQLLQEVLKCLTTLYIIMIIHTTYSTYVIRDTELFNYTYMYVYLRIILYYHMTFLLGQKIFIHNIIFYCLLFFFFANTKFISFYKLYSVHAMCYIGTY